MPLPSDQDLDLATRVAMAEGDSQGPNGWAGMFHVMKNRMAQPDQWGDNMPYMIKHGGFEAYNDPNPTQVKYLNPALTPRTDPLYQQVRSVAEGVFNGKVPDPTYGSTSFYSPTGQQAKGRSPPSWDKGPAVNIKQHKFLGGNGGPTQDQFEKALQPYSTAPAAAAPAVGQDVIDKFNRGLQPYTKEIIGAKPEPKPVVQPTTTMGPEGTVAPQPTAFSPQSAAAASPAASITAPVPAGPTPLGAGLQGQGEDEPWNTAIPKAMGTYGVRLGAGLGGIAGTLINDLPKAAIAGGAHLISGKPYGDIRQSLEQPVGADRPVAGMLQKILSAPATPSQIETGTLGQGGGYQPSSPTGQVLMDTAEPVGQAIAGPSTMAPVGAAIGSTVSGGLRKMGAEEPYATGLGIVADWLLGRGAGAGRTPPNALQADLIRTGRDKYLIPMDATDASGPGLFNRALGGGSPQAPKAAAWQNAVVEQTGGDLNGNMPTKLDGQFVRDALTRQGNTMSGIAAKYSMPLQGTQALGDLRVIGSDAMNYLGNGKPIAKIINDIESSSTNNAGMIPGQAWNNFMRGTGDLSRMIRQGGESAPYAMRIRDWLQHQFEGVASPDDLAAYKTAKGQYAATKIIEPQILKGEPGVIDPNKLQTDTWDYKPSASSYENVDNLHELGNIGKIIAQKTSTTKSPTLLASFLHAPGKLLTTGSTGLAAGLGIGAVEHPEILASAGSHLPAIAALIGTTLATAPAVRAFGRAYARDPMVVDSLLSGQRAPNTVLQGGLRGMLPQVVGY